MAFVKDMIRMWLRSWKRFVSIAMITLLGVAVLTGIYAGCRDAFLASDRFFDAQGMHDIQVLSTAGLSDADVTALRRVTGVRKVQAERSQSVTIDVGGDKSVTMQEIGTNGIDQPYLQEGRMPTKSGEVAVTKQFIKDSGHTIGDRITVTPEASQVSDSGESDTSAVSDEQSPEFPTELRIVGVVLDPQNLSNPDGYSAMTSFRSTATSDYTFFAPSDGVTGTTYTSVTLLVDGAADESTFDESYETIVGKVMNRIKGKTKTNRQKARRQELIDAGQKKIDEARDKANRQFADAQKQIDENRSQFNQQIDQIVAQQSAMLGTGATMDESTRETMRETVISSSPQLQEAKAQLDAAQSQLDEQRNSAEQTFQDKEDELESSVPNVRWYVQDRSSLGGYSALKSDLSSIRSIGNAFPVVFLLVAVMMSLTAMARMVEEDRGLIGTYIGLGYGRLQVAARYMLFALLACLIGGGLGLLLGFLGIPAFLLIVIQGMYVLPGVRFEYDWLYGSLGIALFVVGVLGATIYACVEEMRQTPAGLMRPKAPRAGSRILLERITPIWSRLGFLSKVTARNIFRFKSRLVMTVGGVAGCTALIICGLAINDTVAELGVKQYRDIYRYDVMVVANDTDADAMRAKLRADGRTTSTMDIRVESGDLANDEGSEGIQLVVVPEEHLDELGEMVTLKPVASGWDGVRKFFGLSDSGESDSKAVETTLRMSDSGESDKRSGSKAVLGDSGVIVSQSAANALGVKTGDTVNLTNGDGIQAKAKVSEVTRNLIGSDIYVSESYYGKLFGSGSGMSDSPESDKSDSGGSLTWNAVYAKLTGSDDAQIAYANTLEKDDSVMKTVCCADMAASFKFDLMGAVVALIVALAGGLALVVLFTLANTNVSERVREMATLKVLGFFDREVHRYVNREMMILTAMGVVIGLPIGRWVGGLLTAALNMPALYFEVEVKPMSYVIAAAATMAFALLVQLFVNPVLDRIEPVSSLKSVE
ncbi:ABC transporter permease [Bifidobacterium dentium]|uniref:ABC-type transporter n=1 Tax=Bifidobacterium dentium (strain ATCC 27534 / DSM 20436 / JCM 1195 / Bd1) TaxID=401473 RepID=D2Q778_BIFDB|nr:ABC transporter permease [Bifidobacterium dentium]ADB08824.1 ABC-type transporter [Bifidobacterium dentium Bd1]EDT44864.1 efflux ABC transporter, permease protein [Bifidobacterium dentium ATCC 27678]SEC01918.1 putative ABC transport system permease protein [Bifidobacterium dentium JCM 1195 = DSM 20436]VEG22799.1 ABC transporter [Bifidobacterium dentium]BAQ26124.1 ABC transporter permease component [Bifidobacterium dentium JCM 1195 = DSM 20436]